LLQPTAKGIWQVFLTIAALDVWAVGVWAVLRPDDLFHFLHCPANDDGLVLCRLLGCLNLMYAPCFILAAFRPVGCGGLALAPLVGRMVSVGPWVWLLASGPLSSPANGVLLGLAVHDALWPLLAAFQLIGNLKSIPERTFIAGASAEPGLQAEPPVPPA
jgi:hypothetical protein